MITENSLHILFRRVQPEAVIRHWLSNSGETRPLSVCPNQQTFVTALQNEFHHYSALESEYVYQYLNSRQRKTLPPPAYGSAGVFGVIADAATDYLLTDSQEDCLCRCDRLLHFRHLTHTIDPTVFIAAFLAKHDIECGSPKRTVFSWPPTVRANNTRLQHILDNGMAENHFHIGGSVDSFLFSWICLMNEFSSNRKGEFEKMGIDCDPLDTVRVGAPEQPQSTYLLAFKAACIRVFLYCLLNDLPLPGYEQEDAKSWLKQRLEISSDIECDMYADEFHLLSSALAEDCVSEFRDDFIPDYAIHGEPLPPLEDEQVTGEIVAVRNYERRIYRPLSGEQRFLYSLFRAILQSEEKMIPYWDVAYAYLLIYCRIRGELIQVNDRVGFSNFSKYQNRKSSLVTNYPLYENMRTRIAEQAVLSNPQVISFEGRLIPTASAQELIKKLDDLFQCASESPYDNTSTAGRKLEQQIKQNAQKKMHYVLHMPKSKQLISADEDTEILQPRNSKVRQKANEYASAIIEAMRQNKKTMSRVTGIDACSEEIDCRPEVFACAFRRIRQSRNVQLDDAKLLDPPLPLYRITYHVGEDFLDPVDGLRAISEAIRFLEMVGGDRLGHAMALGIDCEEWYATKGNTVLLRKQALLDNLVWL